MGATTQQGTHIPGLKPKDLIGIPWMLAFAMRSDGWYLRSEIIWSKPNPMPSSVKDRCTVAHEHIFMFSKRERYYYDAKAVAEPTTCDREGNQFGGANKHVGYGTRLHSGNVYQKLETRNKRSVWTVPTRSCGCDHYATYPPDLIKPCILAGSREGDTILDPFSGSGTTGLVCAQLSRHYVGIDINADYLDMSITRIRPEAEQMKLVEVER